MDRQILFYARNEKTAAAAVKGVGGRLLHVFTQHVFVAQLPPDVDPRKLSKVSMVAPPDLEEIDRLFAEAWEGLQQQQATARFALSEQTPLKWDTPGFQPPDLHDTVEAERHLSLESTEALSTGTPTSLYLTGKVAVGIVSVSGSSWTQISGALTWVSVGQDGTVWGVNSAGNIFRRTPATWQPVPGALKQISVGNANNIWGVNSAGGIFKWTGTTWQPISGALSNVSAAADGTVWGVNSAGGIFRWTGTAWQQISGALKQISVGSVANVWGVNSAGGIFKWTGSTWQQIPGALTNVSVSADGSVWGVNSAGGIFRWTGTAWQQTSGALRQISVGSASQVWGVNSAANIFQRRILATP